MSNVADVLAEPNAISDGSLTAPAAAPAAAAPAGTAAESAHVEVENPNSLANVKAARRAASMAAAKTQTPPATEKPADGAAPKTEAKPEAVSIEMDEKALSQFTQLNKELRASKARSKELEDRITQFSTYEKAQQLAKEGRHYEAARAAGIDVDAAIAEILVQQQKTPEETELTKVQKEVEELKKRDSDAQKAKDEAATTAAAEAKKVAAEGVVQYVGKNAETYPFLAKSPKLVHAALKEIDVAYEKLKAEGTKFTQEDLAILMEEGLKKHEAELAETFGPKTEPKAIGGIGNNLRAGTKLPSESTQKKLTLAEAQKERRARLANS